MNSRKLHGSFFAAASIAALVFVGITGAAEDGAGISGKDEEVTSSLADGSWIRDYETLSENTKGPIAGLPSFRPPAKSIGSWFTETLHFGTPTERVLPLFADKVRDRGIQLPLPIGLNMVWSYQQRDVEVTEVAIGVNGAGLVDIRDYLAVDVAAEVSAITLRADAWVLPFMNVYGFWGPTRTQSGINAVVLRSEMEQRYLERSIPIGERLPDQVSFTVPIPERERDRFNDRFDRGEQVEATLVAPIPGNPRDPELIEGPRPSRPERPDEVQISFPVGTRLPETVDLKVPVGDRLPEEIVLRDFLEREGFSYGYGMILVGAVGKTFGSLNIVWATTELDGSDAIDTMNYSARLGRTTRIGDVPVQFYVGATYWDIAKEISGSVDVNGNTLDFQVLQVPVSEWNGLMGMNVDIGGRMTMTLDWQTNADDVLGFSTQIGIRF